MALYYSPPPQPFIRWEKEKPVLWRGFTAWHCGAPEVFVRDDGSIVWRERCHSTLLSQREQKADIHKALAHLAAQTGDRQAKKALHTARRHYCWL